MSNIPARRSKIFVRALLTNVENWVLTEGLQKGVKIGILSGGKSIAESRSSYK